MSLRRPPTNPAQKQIELAEIFGQFRLKGFTSAGVPEGVAVEDDGTLRSQLILWDGSAQTRGRSETNGSLIASLYGKSGGTLTALQTYSDGKLAIVPHGTDEAANFDAFRTDPNRIQWVRPYDGYLFVSGAAVPSSEGVLLDGSAVLTAAGLYAVEYLLVNIDGTNSVDVTIGRDNDAGGGLTATEYWQFTEPLAADTTSGWRGPFIINGDDDVRGLASAADDAVIQFRVRRLDVGA